MTNVPVAHGIMFHHFHDGTHPVSQGSISADQLAQIIDHLGAGRILGAREWLRRATTGSLEPRDVCLTFDDALLCQYDVALPVLEHFHLTGFWFVYTSVCTGTIEMLEVYRRFRHECFADIDHFYDSFFDTIGETVYGDHVNAGLQRFDPAEYLWDCPFYSTSDKRFRFVRDEILGSTAYDSVMTQMMDHHGFDISRCTSALWMREAHLRDLHGRGHLMGLHSHTHPTALASLPAEEQEKEYATNHETLRDIVGETPLAMSHPGDSYTTETLGILRRLGIKVGFRATMASRVNAGELEFPREDHMNVLRALQG